MVGQRFTDDTHLWGRAMNPSVGTFTDDEGDDVLWYGASNKSPRATEFAETVQEAHRRHQGCPSRKGRRADSQ